MAGPTFLAIVVTAADSIKPVLIDDTAYLAYARHIAEHPLDPYGFQVFWKTTPDSAMEVLAPPVVPYWLALGIRMFGEVPALLKLWMFPFAWLFARSLLALLRRFARGTEASALPLIVLSPAVLPSMNLMIDIPAAALALAALALLIAAVDRQSFPQALAAGLVAALAIQTKYTALLAPPLLLWYGLTHRAIVLALAAVLMCALAFAGWEWVLFETYGQSHFLFHLAGQRSDGDYLAKKFALLAPLVGHLGCLGVGIGLYAGRAIGLHRNLLASAAILWLLGFAAIALLPYRDTVLIANPETGRVKLALGSIVWRTAGTAILLAGAACSGILLFRNRHEHRRSPESLFVVGWVLAELLAYFVLTPFPAARRVFGATFALGILAARTVSRMQRARPERIPPGWVVPFGIAGGVLVAALDTFDAFPEKALAERATAFTHPESNEGRVWFSGHWGFQYYCERAGMLPAIPGQSVFLPGDWFVAALYPNDSRFMFRHDAGSHELNVPEHSRERVAVFVWQDWLSGTTVPSYYGGKDPVLGRDYPRFRIAVYRIIAEWKPETSLEAFPQ